MKKIFLFILVLVSVKGLAQLKPIPSGVFRWSDIPVTKSDDREGRKFMEGTTAEFSLFEIHATTQYKGAVAKPTHAQTDIEELIFVKEGLMKFTIGTISKVLPKGSLVLIPPYEMQAIQNVGDGPLTYYVVEFRSKNPINMERSAKAGGAVVLNADSLKYVPSTRGGGIKYLDRPTAMLNNLELHITESKIKGPSHTPHTHIDTELTIVLEGNAEMIIKDKTYQATTGDIYLMNSNELHGISNAKDAPCRYLAIRWK